MRINDPKTSRVTERWAMAPVPRGPAGQFPGIYAHAHAIAADSKKKEAAWLFVQWCTSPDVQLRRAAKEGGAGDITRVSVFEAPEFKKQMTLNGYDVADLYLKTIELAGKGHMKYRTVHVYPQVDKLIDKAIELVTSRQMSAKETMEWTQTNAIAELKRAGVNL